MGGTHWYPKSPKTRPLALKLMVTLGFQDFQTSPSLANGSDRPTQTQLGGTTYDRETEQFLHQVAMQSLK